MATTAIFDVLGSDGLATGAKKYFVVNANGTLGAETSAPPQNATRARVGVSPQKAWTLEDKHKLNPEQFLASGETPYFSDNFLMGIDHGHNRSVPALLRIGNNFFSTWPDSRGRIVVTNGRGIAYATESGYHAGIEGFGVFNLSLSAYEAHIWDRVISVGFGDMSQYKRVVLNTETSQGLQRYFTADSHHPNFSDIQDLEIKCEHDGQVRKWGVLAANEGMWNLEIATRRANRHVVLFQAIKKRSAPGTLVSWGGSMHQGRARVDFESHNFTSIDGNCNVQHIGGDAQGNITLNTRQYKNVGSIYDNEDWMQGYAYNTDINISDDAKNRFFTTKEAGTQNYTYLWGQHRKTCFPFAAEKGYWQEQRRLMRHFQGKTRPQIRQEEVIYEGGSPTCFSPFLANTLPNGGTPKIHQTPAQNYAMVALARFFGGDEAGNGVYVFPTDPSNVADDLETAAYTNHELHAYTAYYKARIDLAILENWFPGTTLIEDPEVKVDNTGNWQNYNGTAALNYADGSYGVQRPAALIRWKARPDGGWDVAIEFGCANDWNQITDHAFRAPGGNAFGGNILLCRGVGQDTQLYLFRIDATDSGQVYEALPTIDTSKRKAGYPGIINNP